MSLLRNLATTLLLAVCMAATACQSGIARGSGGETTGVVQKSVPAYTLGNGDKLRITVYGHQDLSGTFDVDGAGLISMPLIGQVEAQDLTTRELEKKIVETLDGDYILDPKVSVEVTNYRPFYILGEVGRPGEYPYNSGLTVLNAVAAAGGFTYRANERIVFIKSVDSDKEVAYKLTTNTVVKPGDTLRIGERIF